MEELRAELLAHAPFRKVTDAPAELEVE
jgi:hypothetical protein